MEEKPKNTKEQANAKNDPKNKKKKDEAEELSEEDKELKEKIDLLCTRIIEPDQGLANIALETLKTEVRSSTTSMTSVPKPFKFLKIHYPSLIEHYEKLEQGLAFKKSLSDFLSVLSMTMAESGKQMSLKYLMEGTRSDYKNWGHEYLHHISADVGIEYNKRIEAREPTQDILDLVFQIVPCFIDNNSDSDAVDLLLEVDQLETLTQYVTKNNFSRIYLYLVHSSSFSADQDEMLKTLNTTYEICMKLGEFTNALRIALKLDNLDYVKRIFSECKHGAVLKQLSFQLARQRINFMPDDQDLVKIVSNQLLNSFYIQLAKDLEVLDPKTPDQIYKTHLEEKRGKADIDSAKGNLASTYVNAFVNAGMGKDALMLSKNEKDSPWIYKVKNEGLIAASASLGMIFLFDPAGGANHINDYLELTDGYAKAGAGIAIGLYNTGIIDDCDPAKALLEEQINSKGMNDYGRLGAIIGLGLAYAGSAREDLLETLLPFVMDVNLTIETSAFSALTLSLIFVGKCHEEIGNAILQTLMERSEVQLNSSLARFFGVALGLLFLGQQESCSATLEVVKTITHPLAKYVEVCVEGCAYVGSGNVLKVQQMFHHCLEHLEEKDSAHQAAAVLSIALIASSEEIGNEMVVRSMNHILQYCEISIKRAVPLALAMLNLSNPKINIMDLLTKLSHDQDAELSQRAIIALGLIGAGTNNSRLAGLLRQLASFYSRDSFSNHMFLIRIAQGLLHMGKGLLTIQPYYSERFLLSNVGMAGIIILLNSCLDMENLILGKYHYLLYYLGLSMYPRMAFTIDENLENVPISVRVGQAVDIVGQAGQPKRITGFQTHTSPVILSAGERAEIATEEFIPVADLILEGLVIVKKNPDYNPDAEKMVSTKKKSL